MTEEQKGTVNVRELADTFKIITKSSERGIAIESAAQLADLLGQLLKEFFINNEKSCDEILDDPGIASSFGARIQLAYVLGIIAKNEHRLLNLVRKIRNDFGHSPKQLSFDTSPIKERCLELDYTPKIWQQEFSLTPDATKPRDRFFATTSFLAMVILYRSKEFKKCQEPSSVTEEELAAWLKLEQEEQKKL